MFALGPTKVLHPFRDVDGRVRWRLLERVSQVVLVTAGVWVGDAFSRTQRTMKGKESTHSLPLSTYSAPGGLRQDPGRAADSPAEARTNRMGVA